MAHTVMVVRAVGRPLAMGRVEVEQQVQAGQGDTLAGMVAQGCRVPFRAGRRITVAVVAVVVHKDPVEQGVVAMEQAGEQEQRVAPRIQAVAGEGLLDITMPVLAGLVSSLYHTYTILRLRL